MNAKRPTRAAPRPCPCGAGSLDACCGPLLADQLTAPDAERLMRSRYSAYVLARADYLLATWHPATRPAELEFAAPQPKWIGLSVLDRSQLDETHATVEFVARYRVGGRAHRLHELSRFERIEGRWYYRDGDIHPD